MQADMFLINAQHFTMKIIFYETQEIDFGLVYSAWFPCKKKDITEWISISNEHDKYINTW